MINETKYKLVEIATEMFTRLGYDATSIFDISQAAGLSKATIYHHFDSKEEVLKFCVSNYLNEFKKVKDENSKSVKKIIKSFYNSRKYGCLIFNLLSTPNYFIAQESADEFIHILEELLGDKLIDLVGALIMKRIGIFDQDPIKKFYESL